MPPATNEEQFRFLISCIRWSNNGRVDFQEVANECHVVSKGAAAKRYERMMRAHGIHPNGGPAVPTETSRGGGVVPRARQPKAARDAGDRYGKGKKSDKQKAKQAQFDEERDMDMDDEEESSFHNSSVKGEHFDDSNGIRDTPNFVVKNERNYDGEDSGYDASPSPAAPHLTTFAASQNDGSSSPRPLVQALHNSSISSPLEAANAADAAYLARWTPQPGFGGGPGYTFSHQADTNNGTMPQGEFDFNNYTPRQHTPTPFFSGTREPEEVQPAETIVGCGDGAGGKRVQGEGETVIQVD